MMGVCQEIERSIVTEYRRAIWRPFIKALQAYRMVNGGDNIAVCISGGKDSMLMAKCFQELKRYSQTNFGLVFLVMDPGYNAENRQAVERNAELLRIPATIFETEIFDTVAKIGDGACYLCARMRRGHLYKKACEMGCNKIALAHHYDDVVETTLMSMFYGGEIKTMMPKLRSRNFDGMELIRPLYLTREAAIIAWRDFHGLEFIRCGCRFTEYCTPDESGGSKRQEIKRLLKSLRSQNPLIEKNIFKSTENVNIDAVLGYKGRDGKKFFLEGY